jgi:DNA-binding transcriptional LysR family regulator
MIDWDDVRYFLAIAREGSVRAAADRLDVNHSTVLRRISLFEERLGARLFEKLPSGYRLTSAGDEVLHFAEQMEASSTSLENCVSGRDQGERGPLRVTMPPTIATYLLMPDLAEYAERHPEVELEVMTGEAKANLTNREADVAIRVVSDRKNLPQNLHGLKGPELCGGVYMARTLLARRDAGEQGTLRLVVKNTHGVPDCHRGEIDIPMSETTFKTTDAETQIVAVRKGVGMAKLACFIGDADPLLVRVPGTGLYPIGPIWILTHGELRNTKRMRLFIEFISGRLAAYAPLLAGNSATSPEAR